MLAEEAIAEFRSDPSAVSPKELRALFGERLPDVLFEIYGTAKSWRLRIACVWYSTGFCRRSEAAVLLGKQALSDKSKFVRYRAAELLACSLREDAVPFLEAARAAAKMIEENENYTAAIDAILHRNHAYFWDRDHSGKVNVNFEAPMLEI